MKYLQTLAATLLIALGFTGGAMGSSLGDQYDPYVTFHEINAVPSNPTMSEQRMSDIYDPYILSNEIVVTEGCTNPAMELIADAHGSFFSLAELKTAEMNKKC